MIRIKELRNQMNISQQTLADALHVTQQSIYKYEHGLAEPDLGILIECAKYFNTSVDYLIGATDNPNRYEAYETSAITTDELNLLNYYRSFSPQKQSLLQALFSLKDE